jgi:hypothetical protein
MTERAMMSAWLTSEPLMPAKMLKLLVENVLKSDM